ncbi:MAG: hypothetical protein HYT39_02015 [Candidatus Sungbacteria bacterium]|nr:hypothetical protein [Candidatus Sungbacteria bacterium]
MQAFLGNARIRLSPQKSIGKGGEADVFDIGNGVALKIFKPPDHPDLAGLPDDQRAARERIKIHQTKLPALLALRGGLPERVVLPTDIARDQAGIIIGYAMPIIAPAEVLLRYAERPFRESGVPANAVGQIFLDLHETVASLHKGGVVIGDFNDLNVLVRGKEAYLIDADSYQFGSYFARMFTARFVDPTHCDPHGSAIILVRPHSAETDWYAYAVMLMQSLLFVGPYGGVYRPKDTKKRIAHDLRPLSRITVFHPEVIYPKPAVPFKVLPDDLLQQFHRMFEKDERGIFPRHLIETLEWTKCSVCGAEHARRVCPVCAAPGMVRETVKVRGTVVAATIFQTKGIILQAITQDGKLRWITHENGAFRREDGSVILTGPLDHELRFRISREKTLIGKEGRVVTLSPGAAPDAVTVDSYGILPLFDANSVSRFWVAGGRLMRDGTVAPEHVGDVLQGQTLFWVGEEFGFGFYRAGNLSVAFVFGTRRGGINDSVRLPAFRGKLIDSTAVFAKNQVWAFVATEEQGAIINHCYLIRRDGALLAEAHEPASANGWMSSIRGKCAIGEFLFAATDEGIVRIENVNGTIQKTRDFPDTEPFVDQHSYLFPDAKGIAVVGKRDITVLSMN